MAAMDPQPIVSIVTPSFNQAQYLEATIRSVLEQDYPNIEYSVVDGGSTDGSVEIIKRYANRLAWWISEPDAGQTAAINKGFARARGEVLAYINSDDTYNPGAVAAAVEFLTQNPTVGLVYGDANFIDAQGNIIGQFNAQQTSLERLRRGGVYVPQQAAFWRGDLWQQVGPLDESFYFAMDYDLWVRLAGVSEICYKPGRVWANFRLHDNAKTIAADERCWPEMLRIHRRDGGSLLSWIYLRYYARRALAPLINWRRRRKFRDIN
ncbi:MAG: glycosyltransferase [Anaerolineae bacterium]|nr:glycosyltransferase [Anaerolineae bacterium]